MRGPDAEETVGVLDVGSFSASLVVVPRGGTPLEPVLTHRTRLRLDQHLDDAGCVSPEGIETIVAAVRSARRAARTERIGELFPLATSSIRDARNADRVVATVARATGIELRFLSGQREAELAFLAARRWYGAGAGPLLVVDIGGGTVELAAGAGEHARFARSLPLGARSMTREWLSSEFPSLERIDALRAHVLEQAHEALADLPSSTQWRTVGCSKVLQQLARLAGARTQRSTPVPQRELKLDELREWIPRLAKLPVERRAKLPGISRWRARQALAGAIVAEALLAVTGGEAAICPWSTKDGLLLMLADGVEERDGASRAA